MDRKALITLAQQATSESAQIEFKKGLDPDSVSELIELVKDIISIANSSGGCILIGVNDDGTSSETDVSKFLAFDTAKMTDKIAKYTGIQFDTFEVVKIERAGRDVAVIIIQPSERPIVFENPGTYQTSGNKQKTAFGRGTLYFRHGAKSETACNEDVRIAIDSEIARIRESWLGNIRQVVEAPIGHVVHVLPPNVVQREDPTATAIRITNLQDAPAYRIDTPDKDCPYRQKDVVNKVNEVLTPRFSINHYDIQAISSVHGIGPSTPQYFYQSTFGPKQYSDQFVTWIVDRIETDTEFLTKTKEKYRLMRGRRRH